jgi:hypothetical protein
VLFALFVVGCSGDRSTSGDPIVDGAACRDGGADDGSAVDAIDAPMSCNLVHTIENPSINHCADNEVCYPVMNGALGPANGYCAVPTGAGTQGQSCTAHEQCARGYGCSSIGGSPGECEQICLDDNPMCPPQAPTCGSTPWVIYGLCYCPNGPGNCD